MNSCKSDKGGQGAPLQSGENITLITAAGDSTTVTVLDSNGDGKGDGKGDGIDFNGNGKAEFPLIDTTDADVWGVDLNGDGRPDYYLKKDENGQYRIYLNMAGDGEVTVVLDSGGNFLGFDTDGDGLANIDFSGAPLSAPSVVQNVRVTAGDERLTITWDTNLEADSYKLY